MSLVQFRISNHPLLCFDLLSSQESSNITKFLEMTLIGTKIIINQTVSLSYWNVKSQLPEVFGLGIYS